MDTVEELFPSFDEKGKGLIREAYSIAEKALEGQTRGNGKPFIGHPVGVARIAADEIGLPAECVAAVFLHEATRFHPEIDIVSDGVFGKDVLTMVDGLNKISTIKPKDTRLEAENYKKLIVSYSKDPRVTVLKLADRLEVMRSLDMFPKLSRERKILETLMLYIPLAHQLGLYNMKSEMEDTYFRYAEPEQYRAISIVVAGIYVNSFKNAYAQGLVSGNHTKTKTRYNQLRERAKSLCEEFGLKVPSWVNAEAPASVTPDWYNTVVASAESLVNDAADRIAADETVDYRQDAVEHITAAVERFLARDSVRAALKSLAAADFATADMTAEELSAWTKTMEGYKDAFMPLWNYEGNASAAQNA